jgi:hypothetical protein
MDEENKGTKAKKEIAGLESVQGLDDLKAATRVDIRSVDTSGTSIKYKDELSGYTVDWKVDRTRMMNVAHLVLPVVGAVLAIALSIGMLFRTEGGASWYVLEFWFFILGVGAIGYSVLRSKETYQFVVDIEKISLIRKFVFTSRTDLAFSLIKRIEVLTSPNAEMFGETLSFTTKDERIQINGSPKAINALELLLKEMLRKIKMKRKELGLGDTMQVMGVI